VHASPSVQAVPSGFAGLLHAPVAGSHVPAVWHSSGAAQTTVVPVQTPAWQRSFVVHAWPSVHPVPFTRFVQAVVLTLGWQDWQGPFVAPLA